MLDGIARIIIEEGPRLIGWTLMKALTFGRYSSRPGDIVFEGIVGWATIVAVGYLVTRF